MILIDNILLHNIFDLELDTNYNIFLYDSMLQDIYDTVEDETVFILFEVSSCI